MSTHRRFFLGVFFVVAMSILAFYTLFLTEFSLFSEPIRVTVDFPDANAIRDGDPVQVAGMRVGRVKSVEFRPDAPPDRRIRLEINLDRPIDLLEGYEIRIEESTMLGGRNVDIDPGPYGGPQASPEGGVYLGSVQGNPLAALQAVGELVEENRASVASILKNVDETVAAVRTGDGLVSRVIFDAQLGEDAAAAVGDLRATAADLRAGIAQIREVVTAAQNGEGTLGKILTDEALYTSALETVDSLRTVAADLEAGKGPVGALLSDTELEAELRRIVSDVSGITGGIQAGEGLVGRILKDEALADEAEKLVRTFTAAGEDIRGVAAQLRTTEGTLGKLLNDPELYDEALVAIKVLTRSLEDYREAAPVSAFATAIFGAL